MYGRNDTMTTLTKFSSIGRYQMSDDYYSTSCKIKAKPHNYPFQVVGREEKR